MHPADIRATLEKQGFTQAEISASLRPPVHRTLVNKVIRGRKRSRRVEERIAEVTGIPLWTLWPQWHARPRYVHPRRRSA